MESKSGAPDAELYILLLLRKSVSWKRCTVFILPCCFHTIVIKCLCLEVSNTVKAVSHPVNASNPFPLPPVCRCNLWTSGVPGRSYIEEQRFHHCHHWLIWNVLCVGCCFIEWTWLKEGVLALCIATINEMANIVEYKILFKPLFYSNLNITIYTRKKK